MSISDKHFVHRDLKTANIMMRLNGDPVIIDFGYCQNNRAKKPNRKYNVGSPAYMSPEAYLQSFYSEKSDVWALGIILHEMLTSKVLDERVQMKTYFEEMIRRGSVKIKRDLRMSTNAERILFTTLKLNYH